MCSLTCSIDLVKQEKVKKVKAETREMKKLARDKDKPYWTKKAQEVFNQWIASVMTSSPVYPAEIGVTASGTPGIISQSDQLGVTQ